MLAPDPRRLIGRFEAAWEFYGGVFRVVVPDNLKAVVDRADALTPRIDATFLEYSQARGFVVDPARVRRPQDKPPVERAVAYVRGSFWAGEEFADLADAQRRGRGVVSGQGGDAHPRHHPDPSAFDHVAATDTTSGLVLDRLTATQRTILGLLDIPLPWPERQDLDTKRCGKRG